MKYRFIVALGTFAATLAVPLRGTSKPLISSGSLDGHIVVDGDQSDWRGSLQPFGEAPFSVQAVNDGQDLYLRLTASTPEVRREITRFGLTVWFDPKGGSNKTFGIRYPVVEEPFDEYQNERHGGSHGGGGSGTGSTSGERPHPPEGAAENDSQPDGSDRVDVLGPGKHDARSSTRDHLEGVAVAMRVNQGTLSYELKVPLKTGEGRPYAIGTSAGKSIGIGFETPKVNPPASASRGGYGGGGGGYGGGGYGRGGYGGHRGGGGRGEQSHTGEAPKQLRAWGTVALHE
jgi:hypothetical protein